jgi:hypothetical protein
MQQGQRRSATGTIMSNKRVVATLRQAINKNLAKQRCAIKSMTVSLKSKYECILSIDVQQKVSRVKQRCAIKLFIITKQGKNDVW